MKTPLCCALVVVLALGARPAGASGQGDGPSRHAHAPPVRHYHHGWGPTPYVPWPHGWRQPYYAPRYRDHFDGHEHRVRPWRHGRRRAFDHYDDRAPYPYPRGELYFRFP
jgi:hypothetical protein